MIGLYCLVGNHDTAMHLNMVEVEEVVEVVEVEKVEDESWQVAG